MPRMQTQKLFFTGNGFGVIELSNSVVIVGVSYSLSKISPVHASTFKMRQLLGDVVYTTVKMLQPCNFEYYSNNLVITKGYRLRARMMKCQNALALTLLA